MGQSESVQISSSRNPGAPGPHLTYNGHRVSRRIEDDYVDITPEMEGISKEQMEDQFISIVVRVYQMMLSSVVT